MSRIRLFEARSLSEADRLRGLRLEPITPLARNGRWRRETPHVEALPVLIWIARGQGRVLVNARTRGFGPATCLVIPPHTPFALEPTAMTEGTLLRLPDLFEAPLPADHRLLKLPDVGAQAELVGLLDRLARAGDISERANGRAALGRLILVSALVERLCTAQPEAALPQPARLAARFAAAVEAHLGTGANLEAIGQELDVTPTHLTRTLRATCGMTAMQYQQARLMNEARRRLADTDDSAASISQDLGFGSAAYFTRAFGKLTGQTPSAFRKMERRAVPA
ncbi:MULTISPECIES: AraC family transcriptional regulator [Jannaschia]|nr:MULTISPECIES: AraC family transcriptional regulator [unclassified Jannaschia]